jgi:hypothetical protein
MPTVLRLGPYRFFFYSLENGEPIHIHIECDEKTAKFWLDPVELAHSQGFRASELGRLRVLVVAHRVLFEKAWYADFGR